LLADAGGGLGTVTIQLRIIIGDHRLSPSAFVLTLVQGASRNQKPGDAAIRIHHERVDGMNILLIFGLHVKGRSSAFWGLPIEDEISKNPLARHVDREVPAGAIPLAFKAPTGDAQLHF
jgi:hypothetical protein